jgi:hypothetical protein
MVDTGWDHIKIILINNYAFAKMENALPLNLILVLIAETMFVKNEKNINISMAMDLLALLLVTIIVHLIVNN